MNAKKKLVWISHTFYGNEIVFKDCGIIVKILNNTLYSLQVAMIDIDGIQRDEKCECDAMR